MSFTTPFGVTAIDFSSTDHNLLAVGLYDGTVSVYDVREPVQKPLFTSGNGVPGKHCDPVWSVRWVKRGADMDETLVSISSDGRITQWNLRKDLEHVDLMVYWKMYSSKTIKILPVSYTHLTLPTIYSV